MCEVAFSDAMWPCENGKNDVYDVGETCGWQMSAAKLSYQGRRLPSQRLTTELTSDLSLRPLWTMYDKVS